MTTMTCAATGLKPPQLREPREPAGLRWHQILRAPRLASRSMTAVVLKRVCYEGPVFTPESLALFLDIYPKHLSENVLASLGA